MGRIQKENINAGLRNLGLGDGDVVFVSSDLMKVGYFNKDRETTMRDWVEILLDVVGVTGTLVVPSYSPAHVRFIEKSDFVFTEDSASDSLWLELFTEEPRCLCWMKRQVLLIIELSYVIEKQ